MHYLELLNSICFWPRFRKRDGIRGLWVLGDNYSEEMTLAPRDCVINKSCYVQLKNSC